MDPVGLRFFLKCSPWKILWKAREIGRPKSPFVQVVKWLTTFFFRHLEDLGKLIMMNIDYMVTYWSWNYHMMTIVTIVTHCGLVIHAQVSDCGLKYCWDIWLRGASMKAILIGMELEFRMYIYIYTYVNQWHVNLLPLHIQSKPWYMGLWKLVIQLFLELGARTQRAFEIQRYLRAGVSLEEASSGWGSSRPGSHSECRVGTCFFWCGS